MSDKSDAALGRIARVIAGFGIGVWLAHDLIDAPRPLTREDDQRLRVAIDCAAHSLGIPSVARAIKERRPTWRRK